MHRTESDNKITVGGLNQFTDGPPGTAISAVDKNTVQEEIAYVIEQAGLALNTVSSETNQQLKAAIDLILAGDAPNKTLVDWTEKGLVIETITTETVDANADELSLLNSANTPAFISDLDTTFNTVTDTLGGIAPKNSHWYQLWLSVTASGGAVTRMMVPDLTSVADANVANSLSDSGATFVTDLVQVDDEIYNTDDGTKGFVKAVSTENVITCKDAAGADLDLFPLGTETYVIHMLSPTGLGSFKANIGAVYNDSGSDLVQIYQTGNKVSTTRTSVLANGEAVAYTMIDIGAVVPVTANLCIGDVGADPAGYISNITTAPKISGEGAVNLRIANVTTDSRIDLVVPFRMPVMDVQTIYYLVSLNTCKADFFISGWEI